MATKKRAANKAKKSSKPKKPRLIGLPGLLARKLYKTGQTRGADDDEIYQNRVLRTNPVLVPYRVWIAHELVRTQSYEKGYIVLLAPGDYFSPGETPSARDARLMSLGLRLGENALVFWETRAELDAFPVPSDWTPANSRKCGALGGQYVARIPNTTRDNDSQIREGYTAKPKGAGIRFYEYASTTDIERARLQLEVLYWHSHGALEAATAAILEERGLGEEDRDDIAQKLAERRDAVMDGAAALELWDVDKLRGSRILNEKDQTTCPLCLVPVPATGFYTRLAQAEGREVHDLTVTSINLFHVRELRTGAFNHVPYNLGWGCHHCNTVTKDSGIQATLDWMREVLERNGFAVALNLEKV